MARQPAPVSNTAPNFTAQKTPTGYLISGVPVLFHASVNEFVPGMVALDNAISSVVLKLNELVSEIHPDRLVVSRVWWKFKGGVISG